MIISNEQAIEICKKRPNESVVVSCISAQNDVKKHVDGTGYETLIKQVDGHETKKQAELKKSMSEPATIPITKVIIDELNRWTNAQGTNKTYHFSDKEVAEKFQKDILSKVWHNSSISHFVNTDLKESLDTEFNGFYTVTKGWREVISENPLDETGKSYMVEHRDGVVVAVDNKSPYVPYIVFVSIDDTLDFLKNGDKIEYLVYKFGNRIEAKGGKDRVIEQYRFLDDTQSRIIEKDGDVWTVVTSGQFAPVEHGLDYVPAIQISNTKKNVNVDGVMRSQLTFLVSMLNRYLVKDAEHIQSEVLHAFPKHWMTGIKCPTCNGDKQVVNDPKKWYYDANMESGEMMTCPTCTGEGSIVIKDSTQVAKVPQVLPEGFKAYNPEVGGYITPPIEILEYQATELEKLADRIIYAGTSNKNIVSNKFKTATENNENTKTLEDKIDDRLNNIEMIETFLTDTVAKMSNDYGKKYKGCTIKYSRRLFYKKESDILIDIETAKRSGMPFSYIKMLQVELYRSKYIHAPLELERAIILTNLEKFVGYTFDEVQNNQFITTDDKKYKFYFNDAVEDLEERRGSVVFIPFEEVKKEINDFINKIKLDDTSNQEGQGQGGSSRDSNDVL